MRAVVRVAPRLVEVNYMWLPSWIGMNSILMNEMSKVIEKKIVGKTMEEGLEFGHEAVLDFLSTRFPEITGLREYLDGLKTVMANGPEEFKE